MGMCINAPFWAGATLVMVHLDRREVGVVSPRATRAVDGAVSYCKHRLSAKSSRHAFGIAQSTRKECIHLCSHSGPIHGLTWRILMGERLVTQTRVARAMIGAIASTI